MSYRVGAGYDIHRLAVGRRLILGGVDIPFEKGLLGHSDGDCLFHALSDALLGAAGLGDIGSIFPPEDPAWEGLDSRVVLEEAYQRVIRAGYRLGNISLIIHAEKPKLKPYVEAIKESLMRTLPLSKDAIGISCKTGEGLGPIGECQAIACDAFILLEEKEHDE